MYKLVKGNFAKFWDNLEKIIIAFEECPKKLRRIGQNSQKNLSSEVRLECFKKFARILKKFLKGRKKNAEDEVLLYLTEFR